MFTYKNYEEHSQTFCRNVLALRKKYNLTQAEMAKLLGIGIKSLRSLEKGKIPPRLSCGIIIIIYKEFGVFPSDIFSTLED